MPKPIIMSLCFVYLSLPLFAAPADTVQVKDSLLTITDTALTDSNTLDSDVVMPDILTHDTLSTSGIDSALPETSEAGDDTGADILQEVDSVPQHNIEPLSPKITEYPERPYRDTLASQKRALRKLLNNISGSLLWILRYLKHFMFLLISGSIVFLTVLFYRKRIDSKRFMTSTRLSIMDREVQLACKYIENHFNEPGLSIETICEALVTGPAFLEALFEHELGMRVSEFLTHVRINRAKLIITKKPEIDDTELATQVGFPDYALFIKKFKEITGTSYEDFKASLAQNRT